jgi:hypothetical protein
LLITCRLSIRTEQSAHAGKKVCPFCRTYLSVSIVCSAGTRLRGEQGRIWEKIDRCEFGARVANSACSSSQRLVKPTFQHKMYIGRQILPFEIVNGTFVVGAANVSESAQVHDTLKTAWERKLLLVITIWPLYSF